MVTDTMVTVWTVNNDGCFQKPVGALLWLTEEQLHLGQEENVSRFIGLLTRLCVCSSVVNKMCRHIPCTHWKN